MSFFSNFQSDRCPCQLSGNPLNGLCEKVCIQTKKVFDACIKQTQEDGIVLALSDFTPTDPTYPLTFLSAKSTTTKATVTNVQVDRLNDRPNFARVQVTLAVPMEVLYTDASGTEGRATSTATLTGDVVLFVPEPSVIPYEVEAMVSIVAPDGTFNATDVNFTVSCCVTVILKMVMDVELLVPSYGYAAIPPCQEYSNEVCSGFFELPLFPNG